MDEAWLTRTQVRHRLGVPESTVRLWCAKGWLEERRVSDQEMYVSAASAARMGERLAAARDARARPGLLTRRQAREKLGAAEVMVREWCTTGQLDERRSGGAIFVTAASVARLSAILTARRAARAAGRRVAFAAAARDAEGLREATVALAQAKADLMVLETGA